MLSAVAGALLGACDHGPLATIRYRMIGLPTAIDGACPASPVAGAPSVTGATAVRLTFRDATALRCDVVLPLDGGLAPVVDVPGKDAPVDLTVEYVDATGAVLARGQATAIDLVDDAEVAVTIAPSDGFACAMGRAGRPRAFHSATLLPNGEVLLVGGLGPADTADLAAPFAPSTGLFVTASTELYNPTTHTFAPVVIPGLAPRAMHQAYAIADGGTIHIALVGGITATGDPSAAPVLTPGGAFRWTPTATARGAPGEIIDYVPAIGTFTRRAIDPDLPPRVLGAAPEALGTGAVQVGGTNAGTAEVSFDLYGGAMAASGALRRPRVGATVTPLDDTTALVWGGDVLHNVTGQIGEPGELIGGLPAAPSAQALTFASVGGHRIFHAAARTGGGAIVIAGGFALDMGVAQAVAAPATVELTIAAGAATGAEVEGPAGGYPAALTLPDGDVLATGGDPAVDTTGCGDTATTTGGVACALGGAWRYPSAGGPGIAIGAMQLARYGHRLTRLADGTVLVTGGLTPGGPLDPAGTLRALPDAELFEPRGTDDDPVADLGLGRTPGDVARTAAGGAPVAECRVLARIKP
ncbi:MAG: hypothetical protein K8W52_24975 [Deltaproteobacteria bacterium]|nr:hypothetical protein [Deltaproteobacteria bacterium]